MIYTLTLNPALDREYTVPAITFDEVLRASATRTDYGGKGLNVSRMLASLGAKSTALGFVGGRSGDTLRDGIAALGIASDFVAISGETRTNTSIVSPNSERHIKVNEAGPRITSDEQHALLEKVRQLAQSGDWWVLAGSLPPAVPETLYPAFISIVQQAGGFAIVDTSGAALQAACAAKPLLVKPNAAEASQLTGKTVQTPTDALAAAEAFVGIPYVVISLGRAGAVLCYEGKGWIATPPTIQEQNPIGAGDSMVAGLVWGLQNGDAVSALRWGIACGAATASCSGTSVGSYQQVVELAEQVQIQQIG